MCDESGVSVRARTCSLSLSLSLSFSLSLFHSISLPLCVHRLSLKYHPDKVRGTEAEKKCAESNFLDLQDANTRAQALC